MNHNCTVHVVEDDDAVRRALRSLMSAVGFAGECFATGEEFLTRQHDLDRGVLLLDWRMPGIGGAGVLQELKPGFAPIVHSAHLDSATVAEARKLGAIDTIEKPCDPSALIEMVRGAFGTCRA